MVWCVGGALTSRGRSVWARRHAMFARSGYIDGYDASAIWFPVRVGDEVVVGRIVPAHAGAHPNGGWTLRFWGAWQRRWAVALPYWASLGTVSDTLLTAAVLAPAAPHPHP